MHKRVIILGANGMIGGIILEKCLSANNIDQVITVTRKALAIKHPKLINILHQDFLNLNGIESHLENIDICYYCLGVYTGAVNNDLFFQITVDYTKSIANTLIQKSPELCFCFLSGMGADLSEKSKLPFAKAKGIAENYLMKLGLRKLVIFRPGYIYPVQKRKEPNFFYSLSRWLYPLLKIVYPNIGLSSTTLANAMFKAGFENSSRVILENRDIKIFSAS
jgi:nucleoside-diphosphate-sugar epimerase